MLSLVASSGGQSSRWRNRDYLFVALITILSLVTGASLAMSGFAWHELNEAAVDRRQLEQRLDAAIESGATMGSAWQERIKRDILRELREEGH